MKEKKTYQCGSGNRGFPAVSDFLWSRPLYDSGYAGHVMCINVFTEIFGERGRSMTLVQKIIIIGMAVLGTAMTRFLPFLIFPGDRPVPKYVQYLGKVLPSAVFGLLVVYCLRNVNILSGSHGIPELISIAAVAGLHLWKRQMLLSIAGGTICYMMLVQMVF